LQFDVVRARLESEYRVETRLEPLTFRSALWARLPREQTGRLAVPLRGALLTEDRDGSPVVLCAGDWAEETLREKNPDVELSRSP
jgi:peptide chain release factor 3